MKLLYATLLGLSTITAEPQCMKVCATGADNEFPNKTDCVKVCTATCEEQYGFNALPEKFTQPFYGHGYDPDKNELSVFVGSMKEDALLTCEYTTDQERNITGGYKKIEVKQNGRAVDASTIGACQSFHKEDIQVLDDICRAYFNKSREKVEP